MGPVIVVDRGHFDRFPGWKSASGSSGFNPHILVMSITTVTWKTRQEIVNTIKNSQEGSTGRFPFITFQAMIQSGRQLSGVAVKGLDPADIRFMSKLVKEGNIDTLNAKRHILIGKELSKHLGALPGDSITLMVPFGGYSPMGAMPEPVKVQVGGIFETGNVWNRQHIGYSCP
jgi:lipoprotein-releasing system permease protein